MIKLVVGRSELAKQTSFEDNRCSFSLSLLQISNALEDKIVFLEELSLKIIKKIIRPCSKSC